MTYPTKELKVTIQKSRLESLVANMTTEVMMRMKHRNNCAKYTISARGIFSPKNSHCTLVVEWVPLVESMYRNDLVSCTSVLVEILNVNKKMLVMQ
jgi:hypothetical protein